MRALPYLSRWVSTVLALSMVQCNVEKNILVCGSGVVLSVTLGVVGDGLLVRRRAGLGGNSSLFTHGCCLRGEAIRSSPLEVGKRGWGGGPLTEQQEGDEELLFIQKSLAHVKVGVDDVLPCGNFHPWGWMSSRCGDPVGPVHYPTGGDVTDPGHFWGTWGPTRQAKVASTASKTIRWEPHANFK